MRTYQCHKKVKAAQIKSLSGPTVHGVEATLDNGNKRVLPQAMTARHYPIVGDYVVEYEDGYTSISPQKAFEEGYTPVYQNETPNEKE